MDLLGATHALYGDCSQTPPSTEIYIGETLATDAQMIAITAKATEMQASYDAQAYARNRATEYPSVQECVHAILDDTLDALQAKRAEIKTKYPKGG